MIRRNYRYEKEMLHWLDGGEIEQKAYDEKIWEPFDGEWLEAPDWQYRIAESRSEELYELIETTANMLRGMTLDHNIPAHAKLAMAASIADFENVLKKNHIVEPAEKPKEERWLYVNDDSDGERQTWLTYEKTDCTIGKIRMEEI